MWAKWALIWWVLPVCNVTSSKLKFLFLFVFNTLYEVEILEVKVPNKYLGKSILDTNIRQNYGLNIIALERADVDKIETRIDPKYIFKEGDCIVVIGEKKSLRKFESLK